MRIIDHEGLEESCGGDPEFAQELFGDLEQRAASLRQAIQAALDAGSSEGLRKAAHELKGSSLTLGAEALAHTCKSLELAGYEKRMEDAPGLVAQLDHELERLWAYLREQKIYPAAT